MSKRLVIIDGKSVFYRGYYAMPNLSTKDGTPTGGVYGFAMMALEVIKRLKPDYVCVAWDKSHTNTRARLALYPQYKAGRKMPPDDFFAQIPILRELLDALGWPLYEMDDYEADDIMGAFAVQAKEKDIESFLITSDLDVLQLINSHTHIYTLKKGLSNIELFNEASFREKYGVDAHQWVDVKALKGDSSDNVPGVAGIGEKTALDLIQKYKTLDGVYENVDLLKPALRDKLVRDKDMAYLSKKLVTLFVDAPITLDLGKAKLQDKPSPEFVAMLRRLEFRTLLEKAEAQLSQEDVAKIEATETDPSKKLTPAKKVAYNVGDFAGNKPRVITLDPGATELWLSASPDTYEVLNLDRVDKEDIKHLAAGAVVGHNLKATFRALLAYGQEWPGKIEHDTRIGAFLLNSLTRSLELSDILDRSVDTEDPAETIAAIWKAYEEQSKQFGELPRIAKLAHDIDFPTIYLLAKIEHRGILLDSAQLHEMSKEFETKIAKLQRNIYAHAGQEFNVSSPAQLATILFEKLGLPTEGVKKGKTGYSTGAIELAKLRALHPIVNLVREYREYTKLKSTYVDTLPKLVDVNGRLHTTFTLDVTATGRLSSLSPNLQNIPTRTEMGQAIRKAFVPAEGCVFVGADYSQFELRLAAVMANDEDMIKDFNNDIDIHTKTAAEVYGVPLDEVTKDMRRHAKVVNFGILYGMSPRGLSIATGMSMFEAKKFIEKYFELRQPVREYIDNTVKEALDRGYVETIFGRRRPTPDLKSSNFAVRESAKRAAANMPIQGTEADLMKLAMLQVEDKIDGLGKQILQVHDSILIECPEANAKKVAKILKDTMENVHSQLKVKLKVDLKTGHSWAEV